MNQSDYLNGSSRHRALNPDYCLDNGHNIILYSSLTMNRLGKPYRIDMSARQGKAFVAVGVERSEKTGFPRYVGEYLDAPGETNFRSTTSEDGAVISRLLVEKIFGKGSRK